MLKDGATVRWAGAAVAAAALIRLLATAAYLIAVTTTSNFVLPMLADISISEWASDAFAPLCLVGGVWVARRPPASRSPGQLIGAGTMIMLVGLTQVLVIASWTWSDIQFYGPRHENGFWLASIRALSIPLIWLPGGAFIALEGRRLARKPS